MVQSTLYHLSMNTGHVAETPRSSVERLTIDLLRPLVVGFGGPIPMPGAWSMFCTVLHGIGSTKEAHAHFTLSRASKPIINGAVCWAETTADRTMAWTTLRDSYEPVRKTLPVTIARPATSLPPSKSPWLAVWMTAEIAHVPTYEIGMLGDLERCLAWTFIDVFDT